MWNVDLKWYFRSVNIQSHSMERVERNEVEWKQRGKRIDKKNEKQLRIF